MSFRFLLGHRLFAGMAPKKEKGPVAPPEPPSVWQPLNAKSKDFLQCSDGRVTHFRHGVDAVRGKQALGAGSYRIIYELSNAGSSAGFGLIVGVCADPGECDAGPTTGASKQIHDIFHQSKNSTFATYSHQYGWGIAPSSGRLVTTSDLAKGVYDGAQIGKPIHEVPMQAVRIATGMSIAMELHLPALDETDAAVSRRTFQTGLNPLDMRGGARSPTAARPHRSAKDQPAWRAWVRVGLTDTVARMPSARDCQNELYLERPSMTFRINGGPPIDAGVKVSAATLSLHSQP